MGFCHSLIRWKGLVGFAEKSGSVMSVKWVTKMESKFINVTPVVMTCEKCVYKIRDDEATKIWLKTSSVV